MSTSLYVRVYILRFLQTLGRYCDNYLSTPLPLKPAFTRSIKSVVGSSPGEFDILFYTLPGYEKIVKSGEKLPLLVNFHGGGYTIGHAADDARFLTTVINRTPCLAVSVNYRLAPSHPFPTGISDCVSAILYLWSHANELSIDPQRTVLSGFSAGAQFCFTSSYMLYDELQRRGRVEDTEGKLAGITTFYAPTDWTKSRAERAASNPLTQPLSKIPGLFFGMFEEAYFRGVTWSRSSPPPDSSSSSIASGTSASSTMPIAPLASTTQNLETSHPLLSPGLAPTPIVQAALPENICMIACEWDSLLVEGEKFQKRLQGLGRRVDGYVVKAVPHGWDKWPSWFWPFTLFGGGGGMTRKRDEAYKYVAERIGEYWGQI